MRVHVDHHGSSSLACAFSRMSASLLPQAEARQPRVVLSPRSKQDMSTRTPPMVGDVVVGDEERRRLGRPGAASKKAPFRGYYLPRSPTC